MRQKGFSTILSLCLILVIALTVRGIQAAETNHAYETADFQTEMELQNAAESGIVAAVNEFQRDKNLLKKKSSSKRQKNQHEFDTPPKTPNIKNLETITVRTWGEPVVVYPYEVKYNDTVELSKTETKNIAKPIEPLEGSDGYLFFSIAQAKNNHTGETFYRRASAYVTISKTETADGTVVEKVDAIHFMETPMSTYKFTK